MLNKLIIIFIYITLVGCYSNERNKLTIPVVVDKSIDKKKIDSEYFFPIAGKIIRSFSKNHQGITFATNSGQLVRAIKSGIVVYSGDKIKNNSKVVIIKHQLGFYSYYAHNKTLQVKDGDKVKKGQVIAYTGKNNFYFEMKKFKTPINPIKYLK